MNWLQKISGDEEDLAKLEENDDLVWSYKDHKRYKELRPNSYMSIGHDNSNIIMFTVMKDFRLKEISSEEVQKAKYEDRHHGLLSRSLGNELANGRIELDSQKGSINFGGLAFSKNPFGGIPTKLKILDIVFNHYPGVDFYVWDQQLKKIPLLQYWRMLDS